MVLALGKMTGIDEKLKRRKRVQAHVGLESLSEDGQEDTLSDTPRGRPDGSPRNNASRVYDSMDCDSIPLMWAFLFFASLFSFWALVLTTSGCVCLCYFVTSLRRVVSELEQPH